MTRITLTALAILVLTGCQASLEVADEPAELIPSIYAIQGRPVVCVAEPHEGKQSWPSMCAPVGRWMACTETEETLDCSQGRPARMD